MRIPAFLFAFSFAAFATAQEHPYYVYGEVWDMDTKHILVNASIKAVNESDTNIVLKGRIDGKGRYDLELPFDHVYRVEFSAPGYVTKHILMDLNGLEPKRRNGDLGMNVQAALFKPFENIDYSPISSKPYAVCRLNAKGRDFEWDDEYSFLNSQEVKPILEEHGERWKAIQQ